MVISSAAFSGPQASFSLSWLTSSLSSCALLSYLFPLDPISESTLLFMLLLCYSPVQAKLFFPLVGGLSGWI